MACPVSLRRSVYSGSLRGRLHRCAMETCSARIDPHTVFALAPCAISLKNALALAWKASLHSPPSLPYAAAVLRARLRPSMSGACPRPPAHTSNAADIPLQDPNHSARPAIAPFPLRGPAPRTEPDDESKTKPGRSPWREAEYGIDAFQKPYKRRHAGLLSAADYGGCPSQNSPRISTSLFQERRAGQHPTA